MKKRILTLALALVMCLTLIPITALAAGDTVTVTGTQVDVVLAKVSKETSETFAPISISGSGDTQETVYWFDASDIDAAVVKFLLKDDTMDVKWCDIVVVELKDDGKYHFIAGGEFDLEPLDDGTLVFSNEIVESLRKSYVENDWVVQCTFGGAIFNIGFTQEVGGNPTPDVPSSWATKQVSTAIAAGLVPENLQSKYTTATTRAEFCALAVALYEASKGAEITERATFTDTADVNVQKMAGLGVVNGVGDNKFSPDSSLTREQAATMLSRLASAIGKALPEQAPTFNDNSSISSWATEAVGQMQATGIMGGVGDNTFSPSTAYTREQSIVTILRLYEALPGLGEAKPPESSFNSELDSTFLSNAICDEIRVYALSLGFEEVTDYTDSAGGWQMNIRNASTGQCTNVGFRLVADSDHWIYGIEAEGSYLANVERGKVYTMDEMKAVILRCSNYTWDGTWAR